MTPNFLPELEGWGLGRKKKSENMSSFRHISFEMHVGYPSELAKSAKDFYVGVL